MRTEQDVTVKSSWITYESLANLSFSKCGLPTKKVYERACIEQDEGCEGHKRLEEHKEKS